MLRADNITYGINLNVGGDIVTGFITTNGTIGQLTGSDITAYSISDSEMFLPVLNPTNSSVLSQIQATTLSATPTTLITNSTGLNGFAIYGNPPNPVPSFNVISVSIFVIPRSGAEVFANVQDGAVIGTVPEINPESAPSALALVAGVVLIIRGRRTRKVPAA